jgi:hypothetical protein
VTEGLPRDVAMCLSAQTVSIRSCHISLVSSKWVDKSSHYIVSCLGLGSVW